MSRPTKVLEDHDYNEPCRSVPERALLDALIETQGLSPQIYGTAHGAGINDEDYWYIAGVSNRESVVVRGLKYELDITIKVLARMGPGFVDSMDIVKVDVEVDGHEWHERTKEQAARDRGRDRALALDGWIVVRFTGAEVHCNAAACAKEAFAVAEAALLRIRRFSGAVV
jgi:very-short-patch-repair endonuclease